jgi:hypothetical protein
VDATWWSRLARPQVHTWTEAAAGALRLVEQAVAASDPDPKALACYGVLVRQTAQDEHIWLRFVAGRPVSALTEQFLAWCCGTLQEADVPVWVLIWDNASWHVSKRVRAWIRAHNRQVKQEGRGVRILPCYLPVKSPWLNPTRLSPCGSMASAPSSSQHACSVRRSLLTASAPTWGAPMSRTSPIPTRRHD